jgi:glycosyltransferase involved in cell wall biosynthesis
MLNFRCGILPSRHKALRLSIKQSFIILPPLIRGVEFSMPKVMIDGVEYAPVAESSGARIGIAITTHNRAEVLEQSLARHREFFPPGAVLKIIDDGTEGARPESDFRFAKPQGIVAAKNKSLELLMDAGCEHLFLWDDDAYPIADEWWKPYVESPEPHLAYQFLDLSGERKLKDMAVLYRDDRHVAYTGQRGVMLYYHRSAIEQVGGFDPAYGRGMFEHSDLALRIYRNGLTSWAYADVAGSDKLIYSLDEHEEIKRSVSSAVREALVRRNAELHNTRRDTGYTGYAGYRARKDVVLTTLLTSRVDPQRGKKWPADPKSLQAWAKSIKGAEAVVLADELEEAPTGATLVRVPDVDMNVYYRRWLHVYQYLREHPEIGRVWVTDGSDVEMLHEPWADMRAGAVYVGSEQAILADEWMRKNHPAKKLQSFLDEHSNRTMLNAGLLGGDREEVMRFAHAITQVYYDLESRRFWKQERPEVEVGDMAAFNYIAYRYYGDRIQTGPRVHTTFKRDERNGWSWWKHK